jgi:hypothetical protein
MKEGEQHEVVIGWQLYRLDGSVELELVFQVRLRNLVRLRMATQS